MYPLLSKLPRGPPTLGPQLRTILLACGHVAAGDAASAIAAFQHMDNGQHSKAYELAILQAIPFIGIPRVLHSAAALQTAGVRVDRSLFSTRSHDEISVKSLFEKGENTFRSVYGRNEYRVRNRLADFHPTMDDWIISSVYGWLLSRSTDTASNITLRERELSAVAALCVDPCASVQLASHIRGAVNVGASHDEVLSVIQHTHIVREDAAAAAEAVWHTFHRARHAL